jgi:tetratricopeptide (TPR) repeat protein
MANARIEQLKEILEMDPKNILTRYALGMEYSGAGQTDDAVTTFRQLLAINPDYANAYFMGAQALQAAERSDEAKQWLSDGIAAAKRSNNRHAESEMQAMLDEISY